MASVPGNPSKKIKTDSVIDLTKDDEENHTSVKGEASESPVDFLGQDPNIQYNVELMVLGSHGMERKAPVLVNGNTVWLGLGVTCDDQKNRAAEAVAEKKETKKTVPEELQDEVCTPGPSTSKVSGKGDSCTSNSLKTPSSVKNSKRINNINNNVITDQGPNHFKHLDKVKRYPNKSVPTEDVIWFKFTTFLNKRKCKRYDGHGGKQMDIAVNPSKATRQEIVEFILYVDLTDSLILDREYLSSIIGCLETKIDNWSWIQTINNIIADLQGRKFTDKLIKELRSVHSFNISRTNQVLLDFKSYCLTRNLQHSNVTSKSMVNYVLSVLQSSVPERRQLQYGNSFEDIGRKIFSILDKFLNKDLSSLESPEFEKLQNTLIACDERLTSNAAALKTAPAYNYVRCMTEEMTPKMFWTQSLIMKSLVDVRRDHIPINLVAMELGVTVEMMYNALHGNYQRKKGELPSLKEFEKMDEAASTSFWEFAMIKPFLDGVRDTKLLAQEVSVHFGVSRKEVMRRCGGVKSKEELDAEAELIRMKKLEAREESFMSRLENTDLDKQIRYAKRNEANLCEYEKKRLENLEDRKMLLQSLDFMDDKIELRRLNQVIRTPDQSGSNNLPKREKSARIKRQAENKRLKNSDTSLETKLNNHYYSKPRLTPRWFGSTFREIKQPNHKTNMIDSRVVPKVTLSSRELLEITKDYRKSRIFLDSVTEECKEQKVEPLYNDDTDWSLFAGGEEFIVSTSRLTAIDTIGDFTTYGTEEGGVGVLVAGRSVTLRPHAEAVTGLLTSGSRIFSAGRDGTVRSTDLENHTVGLEYCWDMCIQQGESKHGVLGIVQREDHSYILHCSDKIVNLDVRQKEAQSLTGMSNTKSSEFSNIKINPVQDNLLTTSRSDTVTVWDLRKMSDPVWNLNVGGNVYFCGWNSTGKNFAITQDTGAWVFDSLSGVPSINFSVSWPNSLKFSKLEGDLWCPWPGQDSTLFNMRVVKGHLHKNKVAQKAVVLSGVNMKK